MLSLFSKLLIRFILIALIIITVLGFSTIYFFENFYFEKREEEIKEQSLAMADYLTQALTEKNWQEVSLWLEVVAETQKGQAWVLDERGFLLMSHPPFPEEKRPQIYFTHLEQMLTGETISQRVGSPYFERPMLLVGLPLFSSQEIKGGLLVFTSVAGINSTIRQVGNLMLYSSILAILLAFLFAYLWARTLSSPLRRISDVAMELSEGSYGKLLPADKKSSKEIDSLTKTINQLSLKLEDTVNELVNERNKLKYILSSMQEGVLAVNKDKDVILTNNSLLNITNLENKNIVGEKLARSGLDEDIQQQFLKTIETGSPWETELTINNRVIILHCTPLYGRKDNVLGAVGLFQDISERWRFEQLQKDFVTNVSHELKTPLSSIRGAAEVLIEGVLKNPKEKENYLNIILEESNRLTELTNGILNLAEYDSRTPELRFETVEAGELIENVSFIFQKSIKDGDKRLETKTPKEEILFKANKLKIKQVLLNLLDNANKFSPDNSQIIIGANRENSKIRFWVKDEGPGISKEEQHNIWERFYKIDKSRAWKNKGTGLGLAIVKQIVEQHGGQVFMESETGQGSTFGFLLDSQ